MSRIERHPVPAKGIVSIGYDRDSRIMEIEFESGDLLTYVDIPENVYQGLSRAEIVEGAERIGESQQKPPNN